MELAISVLTGIALAASAGLRAFLPLLALSVAGRLHWVQLNSTFDFLEGDVALVALIAATLVELAADKIPFVDHLLDVVSAAIRPVAGAVAGLSMTGQLPAPVSVALGLFFGVIAFGTHVGRAHVRLGSTATTGGLANPAISAFEDVLSGAMSLLAILLPIVAAIALLLGGLLLWRVLIRLPRRSRKEYS
jgi:hypothetical protein